jgi:hypothetical protein
MILKHAINHKISHLAKEDWELYDLCITLERALELDYGYENNYFPTSTGITKWLTYEKRFCALNRETECGWANKDHCGIYSGREKWALPCIDFS